MDKFNQLYKKYENLVSDGKFHGNAKKRYEETNIDVIRLEKPPKDYF